MVGGLQEEHPVPKYGSWTRNIGTTKNFLPHPRVLNQKPGSPPSESDVCESLRNTDRRISEEFKHWVPTMGQKLGICYNFFVFASTGV
jgi:hypothetical protein